MSTDRYQGKLYEADQRRIMLSADFDSRGKEEDDNVQSYSQVMNLHYNSDGVIEEQKNRQTLQRDKKRSLVVETLSLDEGQDFQIIPSLQDFSPISRIEDSQDQTVQIFDFSIIHSLRDKEREDRSTRNKSPHQGEQQQGRLGNGQSYQGSHQHSQTPSSRPLSQSRSTSVNPPTTKPDQKTQKLRERVEKYGNQMIGSIVGSAATGQVKILLQSTVKSEHKKKTEGKSSATVECNAQPSSERFTSYSKPTVSSSSKLIRNKELKPPSASFKQPVVSINSQSQRQLKPCSTSSYQQKIHVEDCSEIEKELKHSSSTINHNFNRTSLKTPSKTSNSSSQFQVICNQQQTKNQQSMQSQLVQGQVPNQLASKKPRQQMQPLQNSTPFKENQNSHLLQNGFTKQTQSPPNKKLLRAYSSGQVNQATPQHAQKVQADEVESPCFVGKKTNYHIQQRSPSGYMNRTSKNFSTSESESLSKRRKEKSLSTENFEQFLKKRSSKTAVTFEGLRRKSSSGYELTSRPSTSTAVDTHDKMQVDRIQQESEQSEEEEESQFDLQINLYKKDDSYDKEVIQELSIRPSGAQKPSIDHSGFSQKVKLQLSQQGFAQDAYHSDSQRERTQCLKSRINEISGHMASHKEVIAKQVESFFEIENEEEEEQNTAVNQPTKVEGVFSTNTISEKDISRESYIKNKSSEIIKPTSSASIVGSTANGDILSEVMLLDLPQMRFSEQIDMKKKDPHKQSSFHPIQHQQQRQLIQLYQDKPNKTQQEKSIYSTTAIASSTQISPLKKKSETSTSKTSLVPVSVTTSIPVSEESKLNPFASGDLSSNHLNSYGITPPTSSSAATSRYNRSQSPSRMGEQFKLQSAVVPLYQQQFQQKQAGKLLLASKPNGQVSVGVSTPVFSSNSQQSPKNQMISSTIIDPNYTQILEFTKKPEQSWPDFRKGLKKKVSTVNLKSYANKEYETDSISVRADGGPPKISISQDLSSNSVYQGGGEANSSMKMQGKLKTPSNFTDSRNPSHPRKAQAVAADSSSSSCQMLTVASSGDNSYQHIQSNPHSTLLSQNRIAKSSIQVKPTVQKSTFKITAKIEENSNTFTDAGFIDQSEKQQPSGILTNIQSKPNGLIVKVAPKQQLSRKQSLSHMTVTADEARENDQSSKRQANTHQISRVLSSCFKTQSDSPEKFERDLMVSQRTKASRKKKESQEQDSILKYLRELSKIKESAGQQSMGLIKKQTVASTVNLHQSAESLIKQTTLEKKSTEEASYKQLKQSLAKYQSYLHASVREHLGNCQQSPMKSDVMSSRPERSIQIQSHLGDRLVKMKNYATTDFTLVQRENSQLKQ